MTSRQDEVRIVQVDPDGNVVYQGASERGTTVRLFDTSQRPLSSTAEKLLKIILRIKGGHQVQDQQQLGQHLAGGMVNLSIKEDLHIPEVQISPLPH